MLLVMDLPSSVQTRPTGPLHAIIGINTYRGPGTCLIVLVGTNSRAISAARTVKSVMRTGILSILILMLLVILRGVRRQICTCFVTCEIFVEYSASIFTLLLFAQIKLAISVSKNQYSKILPVFPHPLNIQQQPLQDF
jgi:hypothetical protein